MAKFEREFMANFDEFLSFVEKRGANLGVSSTIEDSTNFVIDDTKVAIRTFERYSYIGQNRLSLYVTIVGSKDRIHLSAITAGGSQAIFLKVNTWGEESLLKDFKSAVDKYIDSL